MDFTSTIRRVEEIAARSAWGRSAGRAALRAWAGTCKAPGYLYQVMEAYGPALAEGVRLPGRLPDGARIECDLRDHADPAEPFDTFADRTGIGRVDLVKRDIEGAEWTALQGLRCTLDRDRPLLLMEVNRDACQLVGYDPQEFWELLVLPAAEPRRVGRPDRVSKDVDIAQPMRESSGVGRCLYQAPWERVTG